MKTIRFIAAALTALLLGACSEQEPSTPPITQDHYYAFCWIVNASDYYAIAYIDGAEECSLLPGRKHYMEVKNC